jgi:hypothetical protein
VAQRQIRMPVKDKRIPRKESSEEAPSQRKQPEAGRYLLQVDRQTEGSFNTFEAARSAAVQIKTGFPILQVSVYDSVSKSRISGTVVIRNREASGSHRSDKVLATFDGPLLAQCSYRVASADWKFASTPSATVSTGVFQRVGADDEPTAKPINRPLGRSHWEVGGRSNLRPSLTCPSRTHWRSQAARLASKRPRAFFPSLVASAMLSKKTGERSTGADLPAQ